MIVPTLETERLLLRPFTDDDLEDSTRLLADPEVTRYLPVSPQSPGERAARALRHFSEHWQTHGYGEWAVTDKRDGQFIGQCGLNYLPETDETEIDYSLAKTFWGRGIATEAARASVRYGFETTNLDQLIGLVVPENIGSRRVLEHLEFIYDRDDHYFGLDVVHYTLKREQFRVDESHYRVIS